jgi:ArsR family transcriptional regulator, arsenate/arsenite/antimonite-responsive transcriptional repressor / arsenate reductase (thioredoxin)
VKRRVLFLCTGNSARSQLAEALLRNNAGEYFEVASAGTAPEGIDKRTLLVLQKAGISTEGLRSKPITEFRGQHFDYVITLCDKAHKECANFPNAGEVIAWDFADPKPKEGLSPFEITLRELNERIKAFTLVQSRGGTSAL